MRVRSFIAQGHSNTSGRVNIREMGGGTSPPLERYLRPGVVAQNAWHADGAVGVGFGGEAFDLARRE